MDIIPQDSLNTLSLSELRETLKTRGIDMSLPSLSEFVKTGKIGEVLGISFKGNRLEIPAGVAEILATFFPRYREAKGRLPQAESMLRSFLKQHTEGDSLVVSEITQTPQLLAQERHTEALNRHSEALSRQPIEDNLLTLTDAHREFPRIPLAVLRGLRVPVGRRLLIKRSSILRYIAEL